MIRISQTVAPITPAIAPLGVSVKDAAKALSISERTLWQLTKDGKIPSVRAGKRVVYSVDALKAFVNDNRR
jgi:DNA binding domain, excisionase family